MAKLTIPQPVPSAILPTVPPPPAPPNSLQVSPSMYHFSGHARGHACRAGGEALRASERAEPEARRCERVEPEARRCVRASERKEKQTQITKDKNNKGE